MKNTRREMPVSADRSDVGVRRGTLGRLKSILLLSRPDYWPKNIFVLLGAGLAVFYVTERGELHLGIEAVTLRSVLVVVVATVAASANYALNELCDAGTDRHHPTKRNRLVASGQISPRFAAAAWATLGFIAICLGFFLGIPIAATVVVFVANSIVYNVPPLRAKDIPYLDVIVESFNNPIRLCMGWFSIAHSWVPPLSLVIAYWMAGAFLMAAKRYVELTNFTTMREATLYRKSFGHYTAISLILQMFFYASLASFLLGVFIARYRVELILITPFLAACFTGYVRATFLATSHAQAETLYTERILAMLLVATVLFGAILLFVRLEPLRELLNVPETGLPPLWRLGRA